MKIIMMVLCLVGLGMATWFQYFDGTVEGYQYKTYSPTWVPIIAYEATHFQKPVTALLVKIWCENSYSEQKYMTVVPVGWDIYHIPLNVEYSVPQTIYVNPGEQIVTSQLFTIFPQYSPANDFCVRIYTQDEVGIAYDNEVTLPNPYNINFTAGYSGGNPVNWIPFTTGDFGIAINYCETPVEPTSLSMIKATYR